MNRDKFDMETVWYDKESVKYACFVVREYINCKNKHVPSAVTEEEYI